MGPTVLPFGRVDDRRSIPVHVRGTGERRRVGDSALRPHFGEDAGDIDRQGGKSQQHDQHQGEEDEHLSSISLRRHRAGSIRNWTDEDRLQLSASHEGMSTPMIGKKRGTS